LHTLQRKYKKIGKVMRFRVKHYIKAQILIHIVRKKIDPERRDLSYKGQLIKTLGSNFLMKYWNIHLTFGPVLTPTHPNVQYLDTIAIVEWRIIILLLCR
jgi:hypothetical protein